ncbi:SDR family oxidoreductase [bacterium RCC_150]
MTDTKPVLVVGGTGHVGGKVVDELLARGKNVRALVRPSSDASKLEAKGVEIARGDMLDLDSLIAAMTGADAVITSAAGYTRRDKRALEIDTVGNTNLAIAANRAGVRRFILVSILTSDQTPNVPHFWHKKLTEDKLEALGVPFVALRPGAFLDQITQMGGDPFEKKRLTWFGTKTVPLTFVLTSDLAGYLAAAVDADVADGERIDIGWDRPVSMQDVADIASTIAGERVIVRSVPAPVSSALGAVLGPFVPMVKDMSSMLAWFETGKYVADTTRQAEVFGPVPTAEDAVARFARSLGH